MVDVPGMRMKLRRAASGAEQCGAVFNTCKTHPIEFFFPSQPGMAPLELEQNDFEESRETCVMMRCPMLMPDVSNESPS